MESFQDAHYFKLPNQGNIYSSTTLHLTNGSNKVLIGVLKRKIFCCDLLSEENGVIKPLIKEVPFIYIPPGAEIISIDAFNRSSTRDEFFIGIAIIKVNNDQSAETYLNVYTEQDIEEGSDLNFDNIAQNCLTLELTFTPYQLIHTFLFSSESSKEVVWLLSGSDAKVHLFREDPQNHTYCETEIDELFPEFESLPSVVLWMDVKHSNDRTKRLTAFGCECGYTQFHIVNTLDGNILKTVSKQYDSPISCVFLFSLYNREKVQVPPVLSRFPSKPKLISPPAEEGYHLLVMNTLSPAMVFMDVVSNGFDDKHILPNSDKYDVPLCTCVADINMDTKYELMIGTYAQTLLVYKFDTIWKLIGTHNLPHAVHSINYVDITNDGINELIIVTVSGIHIFQHNPRQALKLFKDRLLMLNDVDEVEKKPK